MKRTGIIALIALLALVAPATMLNAVNTPPPIPPPSPGPSNCANIAAGEGSVVNLVAPWYCTQINDAAIQIWSNWEPIAVLVTILSFALAALIIMIGIGIRNDRVRIFGTGELYEAVATAIIVLLFSLVAAAMFGVVPSFFVGTYNPYVVALNYTAKTINTTDVLVQQLYQIGAVDYYYASQQYTICFAEVEFKCTYTTNLFPPLYRYSVVYLFFWPAAVMVELLVPGLMAVNLEFYAMIFMMYAAIPVFLIPGIIFRAFIPTRNLGGMLMAIAIGFYFFMPLLFSVAYAQVAGPQNGAISQLDAVSGALGRYGGCQVGQGTCSGNPVSSSISPASPLSEEMANAPAALGGFWLSVLFYPALISAMTYAFITQVAELLGGMARSSSRLRGL